MRDDRGEGRREALDLRSPVGQQRRRRNQEAGAPRLVTCRALSQHQQQRQHLHRLAEAHVVGEARAQAEARQQMQPSHAGLLIGAQASPSARRRDPVAPVGPGSRRPASVFASHGPATTRDQSGAAAATMSPGTCAPARRRIASPKDSPSCCSGRLHGAELVEHLPESFAIDLDPASAHQVKAVRRGEQLLNLRLGQRFAVEADAHLEVEQRLRAKARRRLAPDRGRDLRTWRTAGAPGGRNAHDDAGGLETGRVGQQLKRLGGRPPQRVIDLARFDHRLQPRALGGGALHGQEQREQLRSCWQRQRIRSTRGRAADAALWPRVDSRVV